MDRITGWTGSFSFHPVNPANPVILSIQVGRTEGGEIDGQYDALRDR
jgi:hypothetical protein